MTPLAPVNSILGYGIHQPSHFQSSKQPWFLASIPSTCTITCECTARDLCKGWAFRQQWWYCIFQCSRFSWSFFRFTFRTISTLSLVRIDKRLDDTPYRVDGGSQPIWWWWRVLHQRRLLWSTAKGSQIDFIGYLLGTAARVEQEIQQTHKTIDWTSVQMVERPAGWCQLVS